MWHTAPQPRDAVGVDRPAASRTGWCRFAVGLLVLTMTGIWVGRVSRESRAAARLQAPEARSAAGPQAMVRRLERRTAGNPRQSTRPGATAARQAVDRLKRCPDAGQQALAAAAVAALVPGADLHTWLGELTADPLPPAAAELRRLLLRRWAHEDRTAAVAWAERASGPTLRRDALAQVALAWGDEDLADALRWLWDLPEDEARDEALALLGYELARTDPVAAVRLAADLPDGRDREPLLLHALSQWAAADPVAALDWARGLAQHDLQQRALGCLAVAAAEEFPAEAAALLSQDLSASADRAAAAVSIAQRWVQQDPDAAAAWAQTLPSGAARDAAVANLVAISTLQSETQIVTELAGLAPGPLRNTALAASTQSLTPPATPPFRR